MRHGAGRRCLDPGAAPGWLLARAGGDGVADRASCRPFDVRADGTIFGSGVAAVVLKPLQAAIDDGDRIHAVIRGSAINNDGSVKMTYAAPNVAGPGGRHRRGARGGRGRLLDHQLRRDPRNRYPVG